MAMYEETAVVVGKSFFLLCFLLDFGLDICMTLSYWEKLGGKMVQWSREP